LELVGDSERHLGAARVAQAYIASDRHDPLTGPVRDGAGE
jgi:hypothetical protein